MNNITKLGVNLLLSVLILACIFGLVYMLSVLDPVDILSYFISGCIVFGFSFILLGIAIDKIKFAKGEVNELNRNGGKK